MRFCGLFVLPCLAVLVPGGALATLLLAAVAAAAAVLVPAGAAADGRLKKQRKRLGKDIFSSRNSEVTLGTFSVRF